ncbi:hypothetical protein GGU10DRAFT_235628, partial [Lentinula aff. detonsa]
ETNLRNQQYTYPDEMMEDHKKTMCNLLKKASNAGATISDQQFRAIVLASLPKEWDADIRNMPGTSSTDALIRLQAIWLQKEKRRRKDEQEEKKIKGLLATYAANAMPVDKSNKLTCTNPNCGKVGHSIQKCWAKGGGAEGKGP